jgi:hypothetical protein
MIRITLQFNLRSVEFHCVMGRSMADVTLLHVRRTYIQGTENGKWVHSRNRNITHLHSQAPSSAEAVNGYTDFS